MEKTNEAERATPTLRRMPGRTLYAQLAELLRGELQALQQGSPLAGDRELCRRFGVSQPVVRTALGLLAAEGRLHRTRGRGTFVGPAPAVAGAITPKVAVVSPLAEYFPHVNAFPGIGRVLRAGGVDLTYHEARVDVPLGTSGEVVTYRNVHPDPYIKVANEILPDLLARNRGVIWISPFNVEVLQPPKAALESADRVVFVNAHFMHGGITCLMADQLAAAFTMCAHLLDLGYQRLAYVGGPQGFFFADSRLAAYCKALSAYGRNLYRPHVQEYLPSLKPNHEEAYAAVRRMLALRQRPDAIFCATDVLAISAMHAIADARLRCPADVAVTGFDDSPAALRQRPPLTTMRLPYYELGQAAAQQLLDQLNGSRKPGGCTLVPCPLVVRESCGATIRHATT